MMHMLTRRGSVNDYRLRQSGKRLPEGQVRGNGPGAMNGIPQNVILEILNLSGRMRKVKVRTDVMIWQGV